VDWDIEKEALVYFYLHKKRLSSRNMKIVKIVLFNFFTELSEIISIRTIVVIFTLWREVETFTKCAIHVQRWGDIFVAVVFDI